MQAEEDGETHNQQPHSLTENLTFRRAQPPKEFSWHVKKFQNPYGFTKDRKEIMMTYFMDEFRLYQVKGSQIKFASDHKIELPIDAKIDFWQITRTGIIFMARKSKIKKTPKNLTFFEENQIDFETTSSLVFKVDYGLGKPRRLQGEYLGELKSNSSGLKQCNVNSFLSHTKPLFRDNLCFWAGYEVKGIIFPSYKKHRFLAEFSKKNKNFIRNIFDLTFEPTPDVLYDKRLKESPKATFSEEYQERLCIQRIAKQDLAAATPEKHVENLIAMAQGDGEMLTFWLFNLRQRKIVARKLISVYELFKGLDFTEVTEFVKGKIQYLNFSSENDLLLFKGVVSFKYDLSPENSEQDLAARKKLLSSGLDDIYTRDHVKFDPELQVFEHKRVYQFRIIDLFKARGTRIEAHVEGFCSNFKIRRSLKSFLVQKESTNELKIDILSSSAPPPKNFENFQKTQKISKEEKRLKKFKFGVNSDHLLKEEHITLPFQELFGDSQVKDFSIQLLSLFGDDKLLIASPVKLMLLNRTSGKLLSSVKYADDLHNRASQYRFAGDLCLTTLGENGCILISQILTTSTQEGGEVEIVFERLAQIDLRKERGFHCIISSIQISKSQENVYWVSIPSDWMVDKDQIVSTPHLASVKIELGGQDPSTRLHKLKIGEIQLSPLDTAPPGIAAHHYAKKGSFYRILDGREHFFYGSRIRLDSEGKSEKMGFLLKDILKNDKKKVNSTSHLGERYVYYILRDPSKAKYEPRMDQFEIRAVELSQSDPNLKLFDKPKIAHSLTLDSVLEIYFDQVTNIFRFFTLSKEGFEKENKVKILILDDELKIVRELVLNDVFEIKVFNIIDEELVYVVGVKRINKKAEDDRRVSGYDDDDGDGEEGTFEERRTSLLLNLRTGSVRNIVDKNGSFFFGVPFKCFDRRVIAFTSTEDAMLKDCVEGLFISEELK